jgi:hypothetical protein
MQKKLLLIVGLKIAGCTDNLMMIEDCDCGLDISSTLPYVNGSYEMEYNQDMAQTYTVLDAVTACGWSQHLLWDTDYEYRIGNDWVSLVNPASMTDDNGNAKVIFTAWKSFIDKTVMVYCGYTDDCEHHFLDSLNIKIVDNE